MIRGLIKRLGDLTAVDGLSLTARPGASIAPLGPNGSGKTTTMSLLVGLLDADDGEAQLFGTSPRRAAREGRVGVMRQDVELMSGVRVGQLLAFVHRLYPTPADLPEFIEALELGGLLRRRTDRLSGGQAQRVRFALAAAGDPALLVLGYLLKKTHSALRTAMDQTLRPRGLSVPQYACMELLAQRPGLSNAELARGAFVTRQSMNVLLRGLQRAGLVERASVAETGRALPARLTVAGHSLLAEASRTVHAVEARLTSALDHDQQTQLRGLLTDCLHALQPAEETSTTR